VTIEQARLPDGLKVERFEAKPSEDKISVWISASEQIGEISDHFSLAASLNLEGKRYRKVTPDIVVKVLRKQSGPEVAANR
jgi:hypothetical protein